MKITEAAKSEKFEFRNSKFYFVLSVVKFFSSASYRLAENFPGFIRADKSLI